MSESLHSLFFLFCKSYVFYIQEKELELKNLYFKLYGENGNADNNNDSNIEEKKEILK